jgi:hypothetical protein
LSEETITFNLELNVEECVSNIRKVEGLLYRSLALLNRLGLPEDMRQGIYLMERMVMVIRLLHTSLILLEAASGPLGWARALVGAGTAAVSFGDFFYDAGRGR